MNRVILMGRLTRDPELRTTAGGKAVATLSLATNEFAGGGERTEFHSVVAWERLAETVARYCGKGQQLLVEGRLSTRSWDDPAGQRHFRTEVVAASVQMLGSRRAQPLDDGADEPVMPAPDAATLDAETAEALA